MLAGAPMKLFARWLVLLFMAVGSVPSAAAPTGRYDPREAFAPFDMVLPANADPFGQRLARPGLLAEPRRLQDPRHPRSGDRMRSRGKAEIRYTNNSPDALDVLWLQLDQNRYRPESRGDCSRGRAIAGESPTAWRSTRCEVGQRQEPNRRADADQRHPHPGPAAGPARPRRHGRHCASPIITRFPRSDAAAARAGWIVRRRRDLLDRPMVSAHGRLRRHARLGHRSLPRPGILSRIRRFRLCGHACRRTCSSPARASWLNPQEVLTTRAARAPGQGPARATRR